MVQISTFCRHFVKSISFAKFVIFVKFATFVESVSLACSLEFHGEISSNPSLSPTSGLLPTYWHQTDGMFFSNLPFSLLRAFLDISVIFGSPEQKNSALKPQNFLFKTSAIFRRSQLVLEGGHRSSPVGTANDAPEFQYTITGRTPKWTNSQIHTP